MPGLDAGPPEAHVPSRDRTGHTMGGQATSPLGPTVRMESD
ncbi:MAG: hypothetical protein AVDCRST_MAG49-3723 [uncultured Thermomicrobiales bacterium]|uniref:Uncharacterized protein n=1 Tax=uncultured Thermomicrobiales bacterium TaxID=1645740 RepID=A0A6J4V9E4_9BACT|nr:MAG: hypothetical protein AVDCRST_MAG49-3723 [uncultured Thermomicrobiales bacterium]